MPYPFTPSPPMTPDRPRRQRGLPAPLAAEGRVTHPPDTMARHEPTPPPPPDAALIGGPLSDEPPMETDKHVQQMKLLLELIEWAFRDRQDYFASGNITIFFSPEQLKRQDFRGPDFFVVLGTERRPRNSWVVWQEKGRFPDVIVELLSNRTRAKDLGVKKETYQDVFRTPEYYAFDPESGELSGFELVEGRYRPRSPDAAGRMWSERLGHFLGVSDGRLRLFTREGELVPNGVERGRRAEAETRRADVADERADVADRRADVADERADAAERRAERLAERLRALGMDPDAPE